MFFDLNSEFLIYSIWYLQLFLRILSNCVKNGFLVAKLNLSSETTAIQTKKYKAGMLDTYLKYATQKCTLFLRTLSIYVRNGCLVPKLKFSADKNATQTKNK